MATKSASEQLSVFTLIRMIYYACTKMVFTRSNINSRHAGDPAVGCLNCNQWRGDVLNKTCFALEIRVFYSTKHISGTRIDIVQTLQGALDSGSGTD